MVTTGRLRYGIVLALAGLLAGLGLVLGVYWFGHLSQQATTPQSPLSALSPATPPQGKAGDEPGESRSPAAKSGDATAAPEAGKAPADSGEKPAGTADPDKAAEATGAPRFDIVRVEPTGEAFNLTNTTNIATQRSGRYTFTSGQLVPQSNFGQDLSALDKRIVQVAAKLTF